MVNRKDHVERRLAESFAPFLGKEEMHRDEQHKCGKAGGHHRAISRRAPGARRVRFSDAVARVDAESHFNEASSPALRPYLAARTLHSTAQEIGQSPALWRGSSAPGHRPSRTRPIAIKYRRAPGSPRVNTSS